MFFPSIPLWDDPVTARLSAVSFLFWLMWFDVWGVFVLDHIVKFSWMNMQISMLCSFIMKVCACVVSLWVWGWLHIIISYITYYAISCHLVNFNSSVALRRKYTRVFCIQSWTWCHGHFLYGQRIQWHFTYQDFLDFQRNVQARLTNWGLTNTYWPNIIH